jgi:hypothetical protein
MRRRGGIRRSGQVEPERSHNEGYRHDPNDYAGGR